MIVPEKTETEPRFHETLLEASPRCYMRINITKNTKGYSYETTVSVESDNTDTTAGAAEAMLMGADRIARNEITRREAKDEGIE